MKIYISKLPNPCKKLNYLKLIKYIFKLPNHCTNHNNLLQIKYIHIYHYQPLHNPQQFKIINFKQ